MVSKKNRTLGDRRCKSQNTHSRLYSWTSSIIEQIDCVTLQVEVTMELEAQLAYKESNDESDHMCIQSSILSLRVLAYIVQCNGQSNNNHSTYKERERERERERES